jgi:ribose transport system ATP-binding protein
VTVFRNGRKVAETQHPGDQQAGPDRGDDRQGPRALEETYTHDIMLPPPTDQPVC